MRRSALLTAAAVVVTPLSIAAPGAEALPSAPSPRVAMPADPSAASLSRFSTHLSGSATTAPTKSGRVLGSGTVALPAGTAVVGVTWTTAAGPAPAVSYRAKRGGTWGPWQTLEPETCSDCADEGAPTRAGSEPIALTDATHVQARVVTRGPAGRDARLTVIDGDDTTHDAFFHPVTDARLAGRAAPGSVAAGAFAAARSRSAAPSSTTALPAAPAGLPGPHRMPSKRAEWRAGAPRSIADLTIVVPRGVVVHHTAGSNEYTRGQVPAILRGIQRFHVQDRGWNDIGYNVLVDRYGRVWEGRRGGMGLPHQGAHASGVNDIYMGVAYIGDSSRRPATQAGVDAIVDVIAWSSVRYGFDVDGTVRIRGVAKPTVAGHYQVGNTRTSCPGVDLRGRLPGIRRAASALADTYREEARANVASANARGGR